MNVARLTCSDSFLSSSVCSTCRPMSPLPSSSSVLISISSISSSDLSGKGPWFSNILLSSGIKALISFRIARIAARSLGSISWCPGFPFFLFTHLVCRSGGIVSLIRVSIALAILASRLPDLRIFRYSFPSGYFLTCPLLCFIICVGLGFGSSLTFFSSFGPPALLW